MRVDEAFPPEATLTLVTFREAVKPDGEVWIASDTDPEKLLMLDTTILEVFEDPVWSIRLEGLLEMLKFGPTVMLWVTFLTAPSLSMTVSWAL